MKWEIVFYDEFELEFNDFTEAVQDKILAHAKLLSEFGPELGRPNVDTLVGSKHANMKELRFNADNGVWRVAFAFDPQRKGVLLVANDKSGVSEKLFYKNLIKAADARYDLHLEEIEAKKNKKKGEK